MFFTPGWYLINEQYLQMVREYAKQIDRMRREDPEALRAAIEEYPKTRETLEECYRRIRLLKSSSTTGPVLVPKS